MQALSVTEKGIMYIGYCLAYYFENCAYLLFYFAALLIILLKGKKDHKLIFLPQALMLLLTVFNPIFPVVLGHIFDVNNEYYRFLWIAPIVIVVSFVFAGLVATDEYIPLKRIGKISLFIILIIGIAVNGRFLYREGYIKSPNIYKMPSEIPEIAKMIHEDSEGRYDGEYYPRAVFEYDYEMNMRQYDASIMLTADREAYLNAISGTLTMEDIISDEAPYNRVLAVAALSMQLPPAEFKKGMELTGTEYICISTGNEDLCKYLENNCKLRLVGQTANHSLYYYELQDSEGWRLPDYTDVWENY